MHVKTYTTALGEFVEIVEDGVKIVIPLEEDETAVQSLTDYAIQALGQAIKYRKRALAYSKRSVILARAAEELKQNPA